MLGRPLGIPKTAIFGLMDLVGIDLTPYIMASLIEHLQPDDPFHQIAGAGTEIIESMIKEGYTGRKGKGGFYRLNREGGGKVKEARNLLTGDYAPANRRVGVASASLRHAGILRMLDL